MLFTIDTTEALLADLHVHPENERIYGNSDSVDDLVELIKHTGMLEKVVVTKSRGIISGSRRFRAAKKAGLDKIPVKVFESDDPIEIQAAIVDYNSHRVKNNRQIAAEAAVYMRIEKERAARRQATANAKNVMEKCPEHDAGSARDMVGKKLNMSGKSAEKAAKVADASDALKAAGKIGQADEMDAAINKGFDPAYKLGIEKGHITAPRKKPKKERQAPAKGAAPMAGAPNLANTDSHVSSENMDGYLAVKRAEEILDFLLSNEALSMTEAQRNNLTRLLDNITAARRELVI